MTNEQSVLLKLIRQSQFDTEEDIDWDDIDLDALYEEANQQAVLGLIAPLIPEDYSNEKWHSAQLQQEASYIRYCFEQDNLKNVLDTASIPFVILKGNAAAIYYKSPIRRAMGDIDFLVPQNRFEDAKVALATAEYNEGSFNGRHIDYRKNGFTFELHHHFSSDIDVEDYIANGLSNCDFNIIDSHEFPMLPKLENGLVLLVHIRQHIVGGLGLRQIVDWMMFAHTYLSDEYWNKTFKHVANEKGLEDLASVTTRACQIYLGLTDSITWCNNADGDTCQLLMQCILTSGNFGRKNGTGNSIEAVSTGIKRKGVFKWLQFAGEKNWKLYHTHHWLKPFCWIYQVFRYTKQSIKSSRTSKQISGDLTRSKDRYKLLKKLKIDQ